MQANFDIPAPLAAYARTVELDGCQIHCYDSGSGDGTALLLVHGLGDEADTWRHVVGPLAQGRRVIAPDLPGFGRSDSTACAAPLAFLSDTLARLLAQLGITRAVLVGSSLGAALVQQMALAQPWLAAGLVLVDGALPIAPNRPPPSLLLFLIPGLGELTYTSLRRDPAAAYATLRPYYANLDGLPEEERAFLRRRVMARVWSARQRRAFLSTLRGLSATTLLRATAYRTQLAALTMPTLILWGDSDHIVPRASGAAMAALLPNAHMTVLDRCGHLPHQEQPGAFVAAVQAWLRNHKL